ncbi:MAG: hypothetical protein WAO69_15250 [Aestuariivita sp.]|uniref:hypothetical protein n=1 Tax=Aestuariivita sp. TaxID=1872407 RepID=UPI003BB00D77
MLRALLISFCLVLAGSLAAQQADTTVPVEECDICTARHKSLQKLQAARAAKDPVITDKEEPQGLDSQALLPPPSADGSDQGS